MEKKKVKLFSAIALITLALLVVGVTYAYFQNQYGSASNADVNVTTYTTDVLTFATGDDIKLEADQTTFGKDKGSVSGATYASALLTANNKTNKAVEHYYLYLNIENNTFTYSVQDGKPELIMTITDKDGNEVKNIEGLTYTEVTDRTNKKISGYDITTKNGLVTIFNNREITAAPKAEDKWNITITFVNYEENQNANTGKVLSAKLIIQKNELVLLTDYVKSQFTGVQGENNLYHHDGTLENGINDGSYRYARGDIVRPGYYSCKYNGEDVSNVAGELNKLLKGDCDSVSMIYSGKVLYIDKSITKMILDKTTVKWDNANNKCVTINGDDVYDAEISNLLSQPLCNGYAYKMVGEEDWFGGIKIEELGPGEETLFTPEDKENQKPALYSCKYNGIDVENLENGDINSSLKGDCSSVFKFSVKEDVKFIDKSVDKAIANKQAVKWDKENNKCVTSTGEDVSSVGGKNITYEYDCIGDAYFIGDNWLGIIGIENMGAGEETLVEPENKGVNNFVCFGSNESPCPTDNLYRIIGVIDEKVKLIKYDYATSDLLGTDGEYEKLLKNEYFAGLIDLKYYKGSNYDNIAAYLWGNFDNGVWSESGLNKINLNTNFLTNIGKEWADKIAITTWKVGVNTYNNIISQIPSVVYQNEIAKPIENITNDAKIGLMYISEYGFAAEPSAWTTTLGQYQSERDKNWMYMGIADDSITYIPSTSGDNSSESMEVKMYGDVGLHSDYNGGSPVRPTFSLLPTITYKSGSGTPADPIRIN